LVGIRFLAREMSARLTHSMSMEGTVVRAQRFLRWAGYTTEISFQGAVPLKATSPRTFCGD
jgi:hypothetical protein